MVRIVFRKVCFTFQWSPHELIVTLPPLLLHRIFRSVKLEAGLDGGAFFESSEELNLSLLPCLRHLFQ